MPGGKFKEMALNKKPPFKKAVFLLIKLLKLFIKLTVFLTVEEVNHQTNSHPSKGY
jgi:hypothetical protein